MSASFVYGETVILTDHTVILDASNCSSEAPLPCIPPPPSITPSHTGGTSPTPPPTTHHRNSTPITTVASSSSASVSTTTTMSYTTTVSMSPSPTPVPLSCEGMEEIRNELDQNPVYVLINCSLDNSCMHIHCRSLEGSISLTLGVCTPGFTISITSPAGSQSQTFTKSGHMDIKGTHYVLLICLTNWDNKVLGLSINTSEPEEGEYKVVPYTNVSIDTSHCSSEYGMHNYDGCIKISFETPLI